MQERPVNCTRGFAARLSLVFILLFTFQILGLLTGCGGSNGSSGAGSTSGGTTGTGTGGGGTTQPPPADANEWTWVGGNNVRAGLNSSVYGTQGTPAPGNLPGARSGATTWVDSSGNFWMFGGGRVDPLFTLGPRNDLWEFSPATKEWTWVSGSSTVGPNQRGIYGSEGQASSTSVPGGRTNAVAWRDSANNLWLFGGGGYDSVGDSGYLNDLWEFNPSTKQWAWMGGSEFANGAATYGTLGTAATANIPGARNNAVAWTDAKGNFWLFGGQGFDSAGNTGNLNDLWEYSPQAHQWTWMGGSNQENALGVYGTQGVAAAANVPGARQLASAATDASGNFWLFGGLGNPASQGFTGVNIDLNDLWMFNPSTNQWTWISGSNTAPSGPCAAGVYGTQGTANAGNSPGGRNASSAWMDSSGNFWVFGGLGCDSGDTLGSLNDLWEFNVSSKTWTWQKGSPSVGSGSGGTGGQAGVYGTLGTTASANTPGGRDSAAAWTDTSGNLWLFGGSGEDSAGNQGLLDDLWMYTP